MNGFVYNVVIAVPRHPHCYLRGRPTNLPERSQINYVYCKFHP